MNLNLLIRLMFWVICLTAQIRITHAAVYIAAHPDDIELFMGKNAALDLTAGKPTVFVLLTAGDSGCGDGPINKPKPYYRARLDGHERAIRFWMGLAGQPVPQTINIYETVNSKNIEKHVIGNVIIYNLNLPDGNVDGLGFNVTGYQSLKKLYSGQIEKISTVTVPSFSYSADELQDTIRQIVVENNLNTQAVWLNIQDENTNLNFNDHSDHTNTARFVLRAFTTPPFNCVKIARYLDYTISARNVNMSDDEKLIHVGTWGALNSGLIDGGNPNTWDVLHNNWLGKEYVRTQDSDGICNFKQYQLNYLRDEL